MLLTEPMPGQADNLEVKGRFPKATRDALYLKGCHDWLLSYGAPPVPLPRQVMLTERRGGGWLFSNEVP